MATWHGLSKTQKLVVKAKYQTALFFLKLACYLEWGNLKTYCAVVKDNVLSNVKVIPVYGQAAKFILEIYSPVIKLAKVFVEKSILETGTKMIPKVIRFCKYMS